MTGLVAKVALQGASLAFDRLYSYTVPINFESIAEKGMRVLVPFGRGNTKKQGIIFNELFS